MRKPNPLFATDFYKIGHINQYNKLTTLIFSNFTPRSDKLFRHYVPDAPKAVLVAGVQGVIQSFVMDMWNEGFFDQPKHKVVANYKRVVEKCLGISLDTKHIEDLHDLGYLPLEIRCLPEGTLCPIQVPVYTVHNTDDRFAWLTNYFESALSAETWKVMVNATTAFNYRLLFERAAAETCDDNSHVDFQGHDFAFRGLSGIYDGYGSAFGHLLSFKGTDTVLAIQYAEDFYDGENTFVAGSIPASEHSVATTNIGAIIAKLVASDPDFIKKSVDDQRYEAEKEFLKQYAVVIYPNGFASYVADSYDYWKLLTEMTVELKEEILAREGRLVFRPDSGDPIKVVAGYKVVSFAEAKAIIREQYTSGKVGWPAVLEDNLNDVDGIENPTQFSKGDRSVFVEHGFEIIEQDEIYYDATTGELSDLPEHEIKGSVEVLWEVFGGTVNSKGYKVLDSHVGIIYGDSITLERATEIFARLKAKGFASSNIVFGIGSYTYNYSTRDTFGFACKATGSIIDGEEILVSKEPKTDIKKKSAKGFVAVVKDPTDGHYVLEDGLSFADIQNPRNELAVVFKNGNLERFQTIDAIRENVQEALVKYL